MRKVFWPKSTFGTFHKGGCADSPESASFHGLRLGSRGSEVCEPDAERTRDFTDTLPDRPSVVSAHHGSVVCRECGRGHPRSCQHDVGFSGCGRCRDRGTGTGSCVESHWEKCRERASLTGPVLAELVRHSDGHRRLKR